MTYKEAQDALLNALQVTASRDIRDNNLFKFLKNYFPESEIANDFKVLGATFGKRGECIFWQRDPNSLLISAQMIDFDKMTGQRIGILVGNLFVAFEECSGCFGYAGNVGPLNVTDSAKSAIVHFLLFGEPVISIERIRDIEPYSHKKIRLWPTNAKKLEEWSGSGYEIRTDFSAYLRTKTSPDGYDSRFFDFISLGA